MADKTEAPTKTEKLVEVRLLRHYVPRSAEYVVSADDVHAGTERETKLYVKRWAGEVLSLPRDEAKYVIDSKIGEITADLI